MVTFAESPTLIDITSEVLGTHPGDSLTGIRFIRSVLLWPPDAEIETQLLKRFLIPSLYQWNDRDRVGPMRPAS